ncbi:MAG: hypothetical protein OEV45_14440 [Desulfobacteraceae bacterium]|nr:hypothetical protein [Desulfobacteraceae bacterium]
MTAQIEIVPYDGMNKGFLSQIQTWVKNVLEKADPSSTPPYLRLTIWKNIKALQEFYDQEKEDLGIVTGEESDFLATHEAWRDYPRIHICHERVKGVQDAVIEGVLHHEIGHALFHGSMEFYTFKFTGRLKEAARFNGFDLHLLQKCVYFLSIAIKDWEVIQWLTKIGLGPCQKSLLEYMMKDTEEEQEAWGVAKHSPVMKKIAMAAFLKIILPIEAMILIRSEDALKLKNQWKEAYSWLSVMEQDGLLRLSQRIMEFGESRFQEKLENAAYGLIEESF